MHPEASLSSATTFSVDFYARDRGIRRFVAP
jgi:hypothetical protein